MRKTDIVLTAVVAALAAVCPSTRPALSDTPTFSAGEPGDAATPTRTVAVRMEEKPDGTMEFRPATLDVKVGDQVRFRLQNTGTMRHEFMLDTPDHNAAHAAVMQKMPGMTHHRDPNATTLEAGTSADLVWRFSKVGTFEFACLIPGHYDLGMHGVVTVAP